MGMKPVWQTVTDVSDCGTCLVESTKGNTYPCTINPYVKNIEIGDQALVSRSLSGEWVVIDIERKYPKQLDITDFPKDENNCLNWVEYHKYLDVIKGMSERERVEFDNHLKKVFKEKYGMKRWDTR